MRLADAILCVNCDTIFQYSSVCPACAARQQLTPLATWIPTMYKTRYTLAIKDKPRLYAPICLAAISGGVLAEVLWLFLT